MSEDAVRQHFQRAAEGLLVLLPQVADDEWARPGLGVWTVRDLVGHTSRSLLTVESYLDPTRTLRSPELTDAMSYFQAASDSLADPAAVADRGRQAGAALGPSPADAVAQIARRVLPLVDDSADDALVATPLGTMRLIDYLPTRIFELVVHGLDLAGAIGTAAPPEFTDPLPTCLRLAARLAAQNDQAADVLLALTGRRPLPDGFSVV